MENIVFFVTRSTNSESRCRITLRAVLSANKNTKVSIRSSLDIEENRPRTWTEKVDTFFSIIHSYIAGVHYGPGNRMTGYVGPAAVIAFDLQQYTLYFDIR